MIRPDKIGTEYISYFNGSQFRGIVENNPEKFEFYKKLGLDIFVKNPENKPLKPLTLQKLEPVKENDPAPKKRKQHNSKTTTK